MATSVLYKSWLSTSGKEHNKSNMKDINISSLNTSLRIALSYQQGSLHWISLSKFIWFCQKKKEKKISLTPHTLPKISTDKDYMSNTRPSAQHRLHQQQPSAHSDSSRPSRNSFKEPSTSSMWSEVICCQCLDSSSVRYLIVGCGGLNFSSD